MKIFSLVVGAVSLSTAWVAYAGESSSDVRYRDLTRSIDILAGRQIDQDANRTMAAMAASGWLTGVYDTLMMNSNAGYQMAICPNVAISAETQANLFVHYMDSHPETHQMPDLAVAVISATNAFPCKKPSVGK